MIKVKVDLVLLEKYFSGNYDFTHNYGRYFKKPEYDLKSDIQLNRYKEIYEKIMDLCNEFGLKEHINTFFNLYFISWTVKSKQKIFTSNGELKDTIKYKTELFKLFLVMAGEDIERDVRINSMTIKTDIYNSGWKSHSPLSITDNNLLDQMKYFILDTVSELYYQKKWFELLSEGTTIIEEVKYDLEQLKQATPVGAKNKSFFIKPFITNIEEYINIEIDNSLFKSRKQKHCFIGKLLMLYGVFSENLSPKTNLEYSKLIENYLK